MSIRIVLADDHKIMRQGLRAMLEQEEGLEVVAEAENGRATVQAVSQHRPDVVVMDVAMPELNGIGAARQISTEAPEVKVIALSAHAARQLVVGMFQAGASGYVLKKSAVDELVQAVREVAAGQLYLSPQIAGTIMADYMRRLEDDSASSSSMAALTAREREVLQLLVEGQTVQEIADKLHISVNTIRTHRQHIMEKLDIYSLPELTKFAIREGITFLED